MRFDVSSGCLRNGFRVLLSADAQKRSLVRVNMYKEDVWGEYASNTCTFDSTGRVYTYLEHVLHYQPSISKLQSQQVSVNTRR